MTVKTDALMSRLWFGLGVGVGVFMLPNVPAVARAGQAKGFGNGVAVA